jgi:hypothetical protein
MTHQLYWGDLHSHCSVSYGHGSTDQALMRARAQLDFCSITGHAFWPDMPTDRTQYAEIIDYHNTGFGRLAANWNELLRIQKEASQAGEFLAIPSYEWHSLEYGDHNVYAAGANLPLTDAASVAELRQLAASHGGIAIPHHIGYAAGYRGINWDHFQETSSPFVEVFSLHGSSLNDQSPYPMLHDMGPRDHGSTALAGWERGFKFGIVGGTDHHGAYPGSWGDGRMGVFAKELTRKALWEAFLARRVYAATGDCIDARLFVDDSWIGSTIESDRTRNVSLSVKAADAISHIDLFKNGRVLEHYRPHPEPPTDKSRRWKLRVTWGWGRRNKLVDWNSKLALVGGDILKVTPCFRGEAIVSPKESSLTSEVPDDHDLPHAILETSAALCVWRSRTQGNLSLRHATTQSILLELDAGLDANLTLETNGHCFRHTLGELLEGARSHYLQGWLSEAIQIGPLVSDEECCFEACLQDNPERPLDRYRLEVHQHNGQCAWLTPIWAQQ